MCKPCDESFCLFIYTTLIYSYTISLSAYNDYSANNEIYGYFYHYVLTLTFPYAVVVLLFQEITTGCLIHK